MRFLPTDDKLPDGSQVSGDIRDRDGHETGGAPNPPAISNAIVSGSGIAMSVAVKVAGRALPAPCAAQSWWV
jgi:hypothetical protein